MPYKKGASSWLSALPFEEHGFALHKGAFSDALCFHYGWLPEGLPSKCVCGNGFNVDHAMNCSSGGSLLLIRHNELRDLTATVLSEACHDVAIESVMQKLTCEYLQYATANVVAWIFVLKGFGVVHQRGFFDVRGV